VVPEPTRPYAIESIWRGEHHHFEVRFTPRFVATLVNAGGAVDLRRGELLLPGGVRRDAFGVRDDFERRTGNHAPPWLFRWPERDTFVLPRGTIEVDVEPGTTTVVLVPPRACTPIFVCLDAAYLGRPVTYDADAFSALDARVWKPEVRHLHAGVELVGLGARPLERAAAAFEAVCGRSARTCSARRTLVESRLRDVFRLSTALLEIVADGSTSSRAAVDETRRLLPGLPPTSSQPADLIDALGTLRRELAAELMPVRVTVVPSGAHFSALPEMEPLRAQVAGAPIAMDEHGAVVTSGAPLQSATVVLQGRRYVFLPAEDLDDLQLASRHELYHLLEAQLLTPAQRRRLDALHAETVANAGPFARPYGFLRQEFLPTMAEVYEGGYGHEGVDWLRRHHGDLAELLDELTGGRTAARPLRASRRRR